MTTARSRAALAGRFVFAAMLALVLAGCVTPRIDWAARIGVYTLDQAILEFGPPDKEAKLQDGTVVADWLMRRGYFYSYPAFGYYQCFPGWTYNPVYVDRTPDYFLRLTFGPDGRLKVWMRYAR